MTKKITTTKTAPWHALEVDATFRELESQPGGLTKEEAEQRLANYEANRLRPTKRRIP